MINNCCDIFQIFGEEENLIKEYKHWNLLIRNRNTSLGNCVAITKRHLESFSEITPEEMQEFAQVVKDIERSLKIAFNYDKINYLMLMMKDKHTHFHILPRYQTARNFAGVEWIDDFFPDPLVQKHEPVSKEVLQKVKEEIINHLP